MAVCDVMDCFLGQPRSDNLPIGDVRGDGKYVDDYRASFRNANIEIDEEQLLSNIKAVQQRNGLIVSKSLNDFASPNSKNMGKYKSSALAASKLHLDVEMETGTGKTYCYIKTIFEMHRTYGWSKFIIVVPSIAIREGVKKSFELTADHFAEIYEEKARFFVYDSRRLHEIDAFSSDGMISVMIMNIQAFNARGADNRRIYEELDELQSRKPIDVISATRPILVLDEPQKMEGDATLEALQKFKSLFILRYSATHRVRHNLVHRLNAVDAFRKKLVKRIAVKGIQTRGLPGTDSYMYLEDVEVSRSSPVARLELDVKMASGEVRKKLHRLKGNEDLREITGLESYRDYMVREIYANPGRIEFSDGKVLSVGQMAGNTPEDDIRRIQIRETVKAHLSREEQLFSRGIKVLSLFFIDQVSNYRDYNKPDRKGEYASIFEEEYDIQKKEFLRGSSEGYRKYLSGIEASKTHDGYFSVDKKRTEKLDKPRRSRESDDVDAYDLILRNKERLLSFDEPVRFIFSHSALREGWDNPNVFTICMLKNGDSTISRHQEVGRGLRLCVDQDGERVDTDAEVHELNILTVIANESYSDFVDGLQREVADSLSSLQQRVTVEYFVGRMLKAGDVKLTVDKRTATRIHGYLAMNEYIEDDGVITEKYYTGRREGKLEPMPTDMEDISEEVFCLIDEASVSEQALKVIDARNRGRNPLNNNFKKKEFQKLWSRINKKATYNVDFRSQELVENCINSLNKSLHISRLRYVIQGGIQESHIADRDRQDQAGFRSVGSITTEYGRSSSASVRYDLVGSISNAAHIKRSTTVEILSGIDPGVFNKFSENPEHFISEVARIIEEQRASMVIGGLTYDEVDEVYDIEIFTRNEIDQNFDHATELLGKHIYDHAIVDSDVERDFAYKLDQSDDIVVYAKLPRGFQIPTPVGNYSPDWAISFKAGRVKHIYFVAETKGSMSSLSLRGLEDAKVKCAEKFFKAIQEGVDSDQVKYGVVRDYETLLSIVGKSKSGEEGERR